jgi:hypothetical protein
LTSPAAALPVSVIPEDVQNALRLRAKRFGSGALDATSKTKTGWCARPAGISRSAVPTSAPRNWMMCAASSTVSVASWRQIGPAEDG